MDVVVLASDSHTLDGCDRVVLAGGPGPRPGDSRRLPGDRAAAGAGRGGAYRDLGRGFPERRPRAAAAAGPAVTVDLLAMYQQADTEVFRLEARQEYAVDAESAQMKAFAAGQPLPRDPAVQRSMDIIAQARAVGTRVYRVHVVDFPLTPYLEYELAAYQENLAAGEDVFIAARPGHPVLAGITEDFVLFDPGTARQAVVWMRYDAAGRIAGRELSRDPADVARACRDRDTAMACAVPLSQFTAATETA